jgi:hypothetical protein
VYIYNNISKVTGLIRLANPGERLVTSSGWVPIIGYSELEIKARAPISRN